MIDLTLKFYLSPLLSPVADGSERAARAVRVRLPQIKDDGLARRLKVKALRDWETTVGVAVIFAESEKGAVRREEINGFLFLLIQLNLQIHGIGFQVNEPTSLAVFGQRHRSTVQINDQRG